MMDNSEGLASSPPVKKVRTAPSVSESPSIEGNSSSSSPPDTKEDSGEEEEVFLSLGGRGGEGRGGGKLE